MTVLDPEEQAIVDTVRGWGDRDVRPVVGALERADEYSEKPVAQMKELEICGMAAPGPYGYIQVSTPCYAMVAGELARGWMSPVSAMGGHRAISKPLFEYSSQGQNQRCLPNEIQRNVSQLIEGARR